MHEDLDKLLKSPFNLFPRVPIQRDLGDPDFNKKKRKKKNKMAKKSRRKNRR